MEKNSSFGFIKTVHHGYERYNTTNSPQAYERNFISKCKQCTCVQSMMEYVFIEVESIATQIRVKVMKPLTVKCRNHAQKKKSYMT